MPGGIQVLAHNQPRPFSRTGSSTKLHNQGTSKQHRQQTVMEAPPADDDADWVSSSSAVASPDPEPENEEEDAVIYVNQNVHHHRLPLPDETPATPTRRSNHRLPNQRHNSSQMITMMANIPDGGELPFGGTHPTDAASREVQRYQLGGRVPPTEPPVEMHQVDSKIHHNGAPHPFPHPSATAAGESAYPIQPGTSVIRIIEAPTPAPAPSTPPVPDQPNHNRPTQPQVNGGTTSVDQQQATPEVKRTSVRLQQEQINVSPYERQMPATTYSVRPAVPGNGNPSQQVPQGDIGRTSQRGLRAVPSPLSYPTNDAPPPPLVPATFDAGSNRLSGSTRPQRPSMLRRDTTPTAISRSPMAIDTPPRSHTPPAGMTHEAVANALKRHSIHVPDGHSRPSSLYQPSTQGKRLSLTSRPGSANYALTQLHGKNNPLALLVRLNTMQSSNLAAAPVVSPSYEHSERDSDSTYMSISPTKTRSLRRKTSASSLNSVATAPVVSKSEAIAGRSSVSPTSLTTSSSAMLKHLSTSAQSDTKTDNLRPDDKPLLVSQFYPASGFLPGEKGKRRGRGLCQLMAGEVDWRSHETAMKHRGLMNESFNRVNIARALAAGTKRR